MKSFELNYARRVVEIFQCFCDREHRLRTREHDLPSSNSSQWQSVIRLFDGDHLISIITNNSV